MKLYQTKVKPVYFTQSLKATVLLSRTSVCVWPHKQEENGEDIGHSFSRTDTLGPCKDILYIQGTLGILYGRESTRSA